MTENLNLEDGTNVNVTHILQTYDPEREQQNNINSENVKNIYSPEFIPYYPEVARSYNLTDTECLMYGFIRFYKANGTGRFYFTNLQLAEILNKSEETIKSSVSKLKKLYLITVGHRVKAGGGTIRFVTNVYVPSSRGENHPLARGENHPSSRGENHPTNNNKINNNKIKEKKERKQTTASQTNNFNSPLEERASSKEKEKNGAKKEKESFQKFVDDTELDKILKNKGYSPDLTKSIKDWWTDRRLRDRKTCTFNALSRNLKVLDDSGTLSLEIVENSIKNGWRAFFPLKKGSGEKPKTNAWIN